MNLRAFGCVALLACLISNLVMIRQALADDMIGMEYFTAKRYDKAVDEFSKTLEVDENCAEAFVARGACYGLLNEYGKAMKDELRAIELLNNGKDKSLLSQAYSNKASIELKQDNYQLARKDARRALKLDATNAAAQSILNDLAVKLRK